MIPISDLLTIAVDSRPSLVGASVRTRTDHPGPPGLLHVAVHSGRDAEEGRDLVYQSRSGAWRSRVTIQDGRLWMLRRTPRA